MENLPDMRASFGQVDDLVQAARVIMQRARLYATRSHFSTSASQNATIASAVETGDDELAAD
ncbi:hypothetical protein AAE026_38760 [Bradyrhizobium sp. DN5]|uniref:hypothetical protein n=1 Tax=Bradyrhizobium sp. DN5 TaxID=3056950 RepID=UPI0035238070